MAGGLIDLHAHLLPGIDDGPESLGEAVAMARAASAAGVSIAAATPHIDYRYGVVPDELPGRIDDLHAALVDAGVALEIVRGGELAPERVGDLSREELAAIGLGAGPWILLECPLTVGDRSLAPAAAHLQAWGFRVLLAHPERSPQVHRDPSELRALVASGARCALTASAFEGRFGRPVRRMAERLLHEGLAHVLTSDAHDERRRPPDMRPGLAAALRGTNGAERLGQWLTEDAPQAILAGDDLPQRPVSGRRQPPPAPGRPGGDDQIVSGGQVLAGGVWVTASALLPQLFTLIISVAAARFLGPDGLGRQSYIAFVALSATLLLTGGLAVAISRAVSEYVGREEPGVARGLGAWMWRYLGVAAAVSGSGVAICGLAGAEPQAAWLLAGVLTALSVLQAGAAAQLMGMQRWRELAVVGMATGALGVVATVTVLSLGGGVTGMFAVETAVVALNLVCSLSIVRRTFASTGAPATRVRAVERATARYALIMSATVGLSFVVWRRSEFFFLQYYSTDAEIAFYSIAFAATTALGIVPERLGSVIMNAFATVFGTGDVGRLSMAYGRTLRLMVIAALPLATLSLVLGPAAVEVVYGEKFSQVGDVLMIMLIAVLVAPLWNVSGSALVSVGLAKGQFVSCLAGTVVNIALAFALIPQHGAIGAAVANVAAQVIAGATVFGFARASFGTVRWEPGALLRTLGASLGASLVALACVEGIGGWVGVVLGTLCGGAVLAGLAVALRILPHEDATWLDRAVGDWAGGRMGSLVRAVAHR